MWNDLDLTSLMAVGASQSGMGPEDAIVIAWIDMKGTHDLAVAVEASQAAVAMADQTPLRIRRPRHTNRKDRCDDQEDSRNHVGAARLGRIRP